MAKVFTPKEIINLLYPNFQYRNGFKNKTFPSFLHAFSNTVQTVSENNASFFKVMQKDCLFARTFKENFTPLCHFPTDAKFDLVEKLCQRKCLNIKDIGSISRYDTDTIEYFLQLPDEKLLKLKDFWLMKEPVSKYFQTVKSETYKELAEMEKAQIDFVKKYIQLENRGFRVFQDEQLIKLAKQGTFNEQQVNKLIFDGGLYGESILEASFIKDLNIDRLIQEINNTKRSYGKKFSRAYVFHNNYNTKEFSLAITEKGSPTAYLKTFDKDFNVINEEKLIVESLENDEDKFYIKDLIELITKEPDTGYSLAENLKNNANTKVNIKRISDKNEMHSEVTLKAAFTDLKGNFDDALQRSKVTEENISFVGKNGEQIVEKMIPSEVDGVYKIVQKTPDGKTKILGNAKISPKTGIKTITKNLESLDGTTTQKVIRINPNGNSYLKTVIKDAKGNILMNRQLSHTFINSSEAISVVNGKTYRITYSTDKISVLSNTGKVSDIDLNEILKTCTIEQREKMMQILKQMSGENLLYINDKVKNFKIIDDILESCACSGGPNAGVIETGNNLFVTIHELFHLINNAFNQKNRGFSDFPKYADIKIKKTYTEELNLFLKHFPEAQRLHCGYFTQQNCPPKSIGEVVAEGGALLNTYNNLQKFSIRSEYLERYFPRTIAELEKTTAYIDKDIPTKINNWKTRAMPLKKI